MPRTLYDGSLYGTGATTWTTTDIGSTGDFQYYRLPGYSTDGTLSYTSGTTATNFNWTYFARPHPLQDIEIRQAPTTEQGQVRAAERKAKVEVATKRGEELLQDVLGEVSYRRFTDQGYIDIPSTKRVGIMYRIRPFRRIGIVERRPDGWHETSRSLCIHPEYGYVRGDCVAAHILMCRYDEDLLWKTANLHQVAA